MIGQRKQEKQFITNQGSKENMSETALYNKYRPKDFNSIVGNKSVIESLQKKTEKVNHPHVYLFSGMAGTGKTTTALIMGKLFKSNNIVVENIANTTGVDKAREIEESAKYKPITGGNTVFVLDEFHMGTKNFQNSLLQLLEFPPKHVYIIVISSEPEKIIPAVKSRCCKSHFEAPTTREMIKLLQSICEKEEKEVSTEVIRCILQNTSNAPRASINLLEDIIDIEGAENQKKAIKEKEVGEKEVKDLCMALINGKKWDTVSKIVEGLKGEPESIRYAVLGYLNSALVRGWTDKMRIPRSRIFDIMVNFEYNFYESKGAGLAMACYRSCQ